MNKKAFVFAGIVVFSVAAAFQQGVLLRRDLKENTTEVYKLQTEAKITATASAFGDGDLDMTSNMTMTLKSGKLDAASGQVGIDAKISDIDAKADGSVAQYVTPYLDQLPKEIKISGKLDARNHISLDPSKSPDVMMAIMTGSSPSSSLAFVEFPEKAVKVGDTWAFAMPNNPVFAKGQTLTATLSGEKDFEGTPVWTISVSGKLNIKADAAELLKNQTGGDPPPNMQLKGTADVTGEALVDKMTGKTLKYTSSVAEIATMDIPDAGITVENKGTIKTVMTLQK